MALKHAYIIEVLMAKLCLARVINALLNEANDEADKEKEANGKCN